MATALGYQALIERYSLTVMPPWHISYLSSGSGRDRVVTNGRVEEWFPAVYHPGESTADHLEFALKYDGVDLAILSQVFAAMGDQEIAAMIREKPSGVFRRRLWFLAEWMMDRRLDLPDASAAYVPLLDPEVYLVADPGRPSRRHRVHDNLLGRPTFCPVIRRTSTLSDFSARRLDTQARQVVAEVDPALLSRAVSYLYTKETMSSFAIERETPHGHRLERFLVILRETAKHRTLAKSDFIAIQNAIVGDRRFAAADWRTTQNYVGESQILGREVIHFVGPKPEDVPALMDGLIACLDRLSDPATVIDAVAAAAAVAFGFVYIHPFDDGNGRLHRYLIHHMLAARGFSPEGVVVPVSATILSDPSGYDRCLETFSRPLMQAIDYEIAPDGAMRVIGDTCDWYRFPDLTVAAEYLYACLDTAIHRDMAEEISFLARYDRIKAEIQTIVDMPDRLIDLFIKLVAQNRGTLSKAKRAHHFPMLSDEEIAAMERAAAPFRPTGPSDPAP
jgi:hypothetical protein